MVDADFHLIGVTAQGTLPPYAMERLVERMASDLGVLDPVTLESLRTFYQQGFQPDDAAVAAAVSTAGTASRAAVDGRVTTRAAYLDAADRGLPTDGVTDASPAIAQTVADAKAAARFTNGAVASGLPVVRIPKGRYKVDATILLEMVKGVTLRGDGMGSTVLYVGAGITLLDLHRVSQVRIEGLTLVASRGAANPGAVPWTDCLIENSTGVHIRERNDDPVQGVSTTDLTFDHVEWVGFHRAIHVTGNQMGDNVTLMGCKWRDNFYDMDHENGQAMNWRVLGGEFLGFVDGAQGDYNTLLAAWSAASRPVTAPTGQYRVPGDTASTLQNVTVRDGAVCRAVAGGGVSFYSTSFIARKTRLLFGGLPTDYATAVAAHGTDRNVLPWTFRHCSGEYRETTFGGAVVAEPGDTFGYGRLGLVRYERPHPASTDTTLRPVVGFDDERGAVQASQIDMIHLSSGVQIRWTNSQMTGAGAAVARLVSCVTSGGSTVANSGRFIGRDATRFVRARVGKNVDGTAWTPLARVDHDIVQHGLVAGSSLSAPPRSYDRTLTPGTVRPRQTIVFSELDGTLPQATVRRLLLPTDATVLRVMAVRTDTLAAVAALEFRDSAGAVLASLIANPAGAGTKTIVNGGDKMTDCRSPWQDLNRVVTDGVVDVVQVGTITPSALGHVLIEHI